MSKRHAATAFPEFRSFTADSRVRALSALPQTEATASVCSVNGHATAVEEA
jgi:hypothetical protein